MRKDVQQIDDGMLHQAFITENILIVVQNYRRPLLLKTELPESKRLTGYVAIERDVIVNEGGYEFGQQLKKFHGKIVVI